MIHRHGGRRVVPLKPRATAPDPDPKPTKEPAKAGFFSPSEKGTAAPKGRE